MFQAALCLSLWEVACRSEMLKNVKLYQRVFGKMVNVRINNFSKIVNYGWTFAGSAVFASISL